MNHDELLRMLDGYESVSQPREVPESVLAQARDAIRSLQAELTRAKHESASRDARWTGCDKERMALRAELARVKEERDRWKRIRTPTHGSCCTCQACGQFYEQCRCDLDEVAAELNEARAQLAALAARGKEEHAREWFGPLVEALEFIANEPVPSPSVYVFRAKEALAQLRARASGAEGGDRRG